MQQPRPLNRPPTYASLGSKYGARSSIELGELRAMDRNRHVNQSRSSSEDSRKRTFLENWSPFPWRATLTFLLLPFALAPIVGLSVAAEVASQSYIRRRDCYPNGMWKFATGATWEIMDSTYFFTPNLSFGDMSFTQVKVIDIAWDLCIGRGGQILLAWVNYRVFNEWLVYHMENHLTSYKFYAAIAFETTTLSTLGVLGKEILAFGKGTWNRFFRWLAMFCMLLSALYVLSFPTLMAAMTGYIAKSEPYLEDFERNLISFSKVDAVQYVVEDATRIGYNQKRLVVTINNKGLASEVQGYMSSLEPSQPTCPTCTAPLPKFQPSMQELENGQYKWVSLLRESKWRNISLSQPSLSVTRFPHDLGLLEGLAPQSNTFWAVGNQSELYTSAYVLSHGSCKPGEQYQWGFSYIFLFMVSIFNFLWACIMVGMWLDTRRGSRVYKGGRRPGLLRCIVEFARVVREEVGEGVENMEEEEIRERLGRGGMLRIDKEEAKIRTVHQRDTGIGKRGWTRSLTRGSTF